MKKADLKVGLYRLPTRLRAFGATAGQASEL
jgi:hypothetical protein